MNATTSRDRLHPALAAVLVAVVLATFAAVAASNPAEAAIRDYGGRRSAVEQDPSPARPVATTPWSLSIAARLGPWLRLGPAGDALARWWRLSRFGAGEDVIGEGGRRVAHRLGGRPHEGDRRPPGRKHQPTRRLPVGTRNPSEPN